MRSAIFLIFLLFQASIVLAQNSNDSAWKRMKAEADSIKKVLPEYNNSPNKKVVVLTSASQSATKRDNSTWENRWQNYIDKESVKIAEKVILQDSSKRVYKVVVDFSINEDGSLKDLKVNCNPSSPLVEKETRKMVLNAPKKTPAYRNGKYVRPHITQPIEIKVK